MPEKNSVVAIFASHNQAEDAVHELQKSGFDMKKLSIVGNAKAGKFLLILHAAPEEVQRAKDRLDDTHVVETTIHAEPVGRSDSHHVKQLALDAVREAFEASQSQSERVEMDIEVAPIDGWQARRCALSETRDENFSDELALTKEFDLTKEN